jgi:hypothetical protein
MQSELSNLSARLRFRVHCAHPMCTRLEMPIDSFLSTNNNLWVEASRQGGNSAVIGQPERTTSNQSGIAGATCRRQSSQWLLMQASSNCKGSREMATLGNLPAPGSNGTRNLAEPNSVLESQLGICSGTMRTPNRPTAHHYVVAHCDLS